MMTHESSLSCSQCVCSLLVLKVCRFTIHVECSFSKQDMVCLKMMFRVIAGSGSQSRSVSGDGTGSGSGSASTSRTTSARTSSHSASFSGILPPSVQMYQFYSGQWGSQFICMQCRTSLI